VGSLEEAALGLGDLVEQALVSAVHQPSVTAAAVASKQL
jgi:hypothetical protein